MFTIRFKLLTNPNTTGKNISELPKVLKRQLRGSLTTIGKRLTRSSRSRMRKDTGTAQKSLTTKIRDDGNLDMGVTVYSTLIQAFIDAYGLKRGVMPNSRVNSELYKWVRRKIKIDKVGKFKRATLTRSKRVRLPGIGTKQDVRRFGRRSRARQATELRTVTPIGQDFPTRRITRKQRSEHNSAKRLTFVIARHIKQAGIRATRWNREALQSNRAGIVREFQNAIKRTANELKRR
jgi:hypothetical protein